MVLTFKPTSALKFQKKPQAVAETSYGVSPATATFFKLGRVQAITPLIAPQSDKGYDLGGSQLSYAVLQGVNYGINLVYKPFNSQFMKYGINLANDAAPSGNNAESLTMVYSQLLDGVEKYRLLQGLKTNTCRVDVNKKTGVTVTQDMIANFYSSWLASPTGITTPTYVTGADALPFTSLDGGATPMTIEGTDVRTDSFSFTVNHNLVRVDSNGSFNLDYVGDAHHDVTVSFQTWSKDGVLIGNLINYDPVDIVYTIKSDPTTPTRITLLDCKFDTYASPDNAQTNDLKRETYSGVCTGGFTFTGL